MLIVSYMVILHDLEQTCHETENLLVDGCNNAVHSMISINTGRRNVVNVKNVGMTFLKSLGYGGDQHSIEHTNGNHIYTKHRFRNISNN